MQDRSTFRCNDFVKNRLNTCNTISDAVRPQTLFCILSNKKSGSGSLSGVLSWVRARLIVVAQKFITMNIRATPVFLSSIGYAFDFFLLICLKL